MRLWKKRLEQEDVSSICCCVLQHNCIAHNLRFTKLLQKSVASILFMHIVHILCYMMFTLNFKVVLWFPVNMFSKSESCLYFVSINAWTDTFSLFHRCYLNNPTFVHGYISIYLGVSGLCCMSVSTIPVYFYLLI